MTGFYIQTKDKSILRFRFYREAAPVTSNAFAKTLPFHKTFIHASVSGREIWTGEAPELDIIQENASVFVEPGEVVIGPLKPSRARTAKCMGVYYGEGSGLDACNIFARVFEEDMPLLKQLGETIWEKGAQELNFRPLD